MERRKLGSNGPELTVMGFGTWAIGGPWEFGWGPVNDEQSINAIRRGIELGINWIDTAAVYGLGHSEEIVARAVQNHRKDIFIATKCGMVWNDAKRVKIHASPASIRHEITMSLKRLNTDYIDLYQIHWPDPETPLEDSWGTMAELRAEGKARYIGVCNYDADMLTKCTKIAPVQSLQPPYSLLRRQIESEILPYCQKNGIGVIVYSPMQSGLLSGSFDINKVAPDDWRLRNKYFREPYLSRVLKLVDDLRPIAKSKGISVGRLAIDWVLHHRAVTSAIVGARIGTQMTEIAGTSGATLSDDDYEKIVHLLSKF
jgi:aryl-alcohol dehydrogenase-like predicted oxidoreductase